MLSSSPRDNEVEQLVLYCMNIGHSHQVGARMTNHNDVPVDIQAPATVQTVVWCEAIWTGAGENGIVVLELVVRM